MLRSRKPVMRASLMLSVPLSTREDDDRRHGTRGCWVPHNASWESLIARG
jgi:hypothetical protein